MAVIRNHSDTLFVFVDSIALLDVLCSFAELANKTPSSFSRPIITESGPMVVSEGRHIILMCLEEQSRNIFGHLVSNDTYLSPLDSFQIITGCNGAGKSIYIKQVALIVVMAQIGCFVPAVHATIPLRDRILRQFAVKQNYEFVFIY